MKKGIFLGLKILISAAILIFLFFKIPLKEIIFSIESADVLLIVSSLFIILLCNYLSAFETRYLINTQDMSISTMEILKIHLTSMYYSLFLPGGLAGGAIKWYKFSKYGSKSDSAAIVVVNRYLELFMLLFTGIVFSSQIFMKRGFYELLFLWCIIVIFMLTLFFLMLKTSTLFLLKKIISHIPFPGRMKNIIDKLLGSIQKFQKLSRIDICKVFSLLFLYHSLGILASFLLAFSLGLNIDFFNIAWIRSVMGIIALLPISIAGLGVREGSLVVLLAVYGISPGKSMAYSFLLFFCTIIISLIGGVIEMYDLFKRDKTSKERNEISL